jgi:ABC-type uncharacterized transport system substrate-binding protein
MQELARDIVGLQPDLIVANTKPVTAALQRETKIIPIVFVIVSDPVGDGLVGSIAMSESSPKLVSKRSSLPANLILPCCYRRRSTVIGIPYRGRKVMRP